MNSNTSQKTRNSKIFKLPTKSSLNQRGRYSKNESSDESEDNNNSWLDSSDFEIESRKCNYYTDRAAKNNELITTSIDSTRIFTKVNRKKKFDSRDSTDSKNTSSKLKAEEVSNKILECMKTSTFLEKELKDLKNSYDFTGGNLASEAKLDSKLEDVKNEFKKNDEKLQLAYKDLDKLKELPNFRYERAKKNLFDYTEYTTDRDNWRQLSLARKDLVQSKEFKKLLRKDDDKPFSIFNEDEEEEKDSWKIALDKAGELNSEAVLAVFSDKSEGNFHKAVDNLRQSIRIWTNAEIRMSKSVLNIKELKASNDYSHLNQHMRTSYSDLAKLTFMPKLYGFDLSELSSIWKRDDVMSNLEGIIKGDVEVGEQIKNVVKSIYKISKSIDSDSLCDSKFLQHQVEEYTKLSSKPDESNAEAATIGKTIKSFSAKRKEVWSDPDLSKYLQVFMTEITSSYRIAEMINSGQFQLIQKDDSVIVTSCIELLNLVPMWGAILSAAAKQVDKLVAQAVEEMIKQACKNTINSFYHKVLEETVELVCVEVLLAHGDLIKSRIQNIQDQKYDRKNGSKVFKWVNAQFDGLKEYVKSDLDKYIPHKFLTNKYTEASEIIAYRDSWYMKEHIGQGDFLLQSYDHSGKPIFDIKAGKMEELLIKTINKTEENTTNKIFEKPDKCFWSTMKCTIF